MLKCPINYVGNKYSLLNQLLPLLPETNNFVDLFGGSFTLGINKDSDNLYYNEYDPKLFKLIKYLCEVDEEKFLLEVEDVIEKFSLNKYDKDSFNKFRSYYNEGRQSELYLFVLLCFSYNHQIRFNSSGKFNTPHGTGTTHFSSKMKENFISFNRGAKEKNIIFSNKDFANVDIGDFPEDSIFYCDPPYLISLATYNENGVWNPTREKQLLQFLDDVSSDCKRFALSNVVEHKGKQNKILLDWIDQRGYHCHSIEKKYKSQKTHKNKNTTREVLVTNY